MNERVPGENVSGSVELLQARCRQLISDSVRQTPLVINHFNDNRQ